MERTNLIVFMCGWIALGSLQGCGKAVNRLLWGPDTKDAQIESQTVLPPLRTIACCQPIQSTTKDYCNRLLGPEGKHKDGNGYIIEEGYFNFALIGSCDHAMVK